MARRAESMERAVLNVRCKNVSKNGARGNVQVGAITRARTKVERVIKGLWGDCRGTILGREVLPLSIYIFFIFSSFVDQGTIKRRIGNKEEKKVERREEEINRR